jgi:hypothetical protein
MMVFTYPNNPMILFLPGHLWLVAAPQDDAGRPVVEKVIAGLLAIQEVGGIPASKPEDALSKGMALLNKLTFCTQDGEGSDAAKKCPWYTVLVMQTTMTVNLTKAIDKQGVSKLKEWAKENNIEKIKSFFTHPTTTIQQCISTVADFKEVLDFNVPKGLAGKEMLVTFDMLARAFCLDNKMLESIVPLEAVKVAEKLSQFEENLKLYLEQKKIDIESLQVLCAKYK